MRVPLSWLRPMVPGLSATPEDIAKALVRAGLEVEQVHRYGHDISGVVVGRVVDVEELPGFKKPIRFCHVDTGARVHDVVCGATNFAAGDLVPFAQPGAELPGGFRIAARNAYGRLSDGMICSEAELGMSDSSEGILVLAPDAALGADVVELLGLRDEVLDIAITPDRGYTLSIRGVAREVATAFSLPLEDPAAVALPTLSGGYDIQLPDSGCDRYVARTIEGLDPAVPSPVWLQRRLTLAGMRPISLAVDVTNHVMLELGQPLHAFDLDTLRGPIVVRRATSGEQLTTLDGAERTLDPGDLLITDDSGPIALAGVMGGARTEISAQTTRILLESAHFDPTTVTRTARRHRLPSEASKRFERGVDHALAAAAAEAAVRLLEELGGMTPGAGTDVDQRDGVAPLILDATAPGRVAGRSYERDVVVQRLVDIGCEVSGESTLTVTPPSWRPDITGAAELIEEVIRLEGYDEVPVVLPVAPAGRGLSQEQRHRRTASRALAAAGLVEVVTAPFVSEALLETLGQTQHEPPRLLNPLSEEEALLRPSLVPSLLTVLLRNVGRGQHDVAIYELGSVFRGQGSTVAAVPGVEGRPSEKDLAALDAALPRQPRNAAVATAGARGTVGAVVEALVATARSVGVTLTIERGQDQPYHPGRCAVLLLDGTPVGTAGELHPRVITALDLPAQTCVGELDLDALVAAATSAGPVAAPVVSPYPPSSVDIALVVDEDVLAADVERTLHAAAGPLLEHIALFDVFRGEQVGAGRKSLAFSLRFRAPDRTLTDAEVNGARDAAIAAAWEAHDAVLRGA